MIRKDGALHKLPRRHGAPRPYRGGVAAGGASRTGLVPGAAGRNRRDQCDVLRVVESSSRRPLSRKERLENGPRRRARAQHAEDLAEEQQRLDQGMEDRADHAVERGSRRGDAVAVVCTTGSSAEGVRISSAFIRDDDLARSTPGKVTAPLSSGGRRPSRTDVVDPPEGPIIVVDVRPWRRKVDGRRDSCARNRWPGAPGDGDASLVS